MFCCLSAETLEPSGHLQPDGTWEEDILHNQLTFYVVITVGINEDR